MTDLEQIIQMTPLIDTHEHLHGETKYLEQPTDILHALFGHYTTHDLATAGATLEAIRVLVNEPEEGIAKRFRGVQRAWEAIQFTGYGEGVRLAARKLYGIEEITPESLEAATAHHVQYLQPGGRRHLLQEVANLHHVQVDNFVWECLPDESGVEFFRYDISWLEFAQGNVPIEKLHQETGIVVHDLDSLREAMAGIFAKYSPYAVAVKTQHAYTRTLFWENQHDSEVAPVLAKHVEGQELTIAERLCLGNWCLARGVEFAAQYNLPVKIHTGHYAGNRTMQMDRIRPSHLCQLLSAYPQTRFIIMHIGYPYTDELVSLAKHFPNVWVDFCWTWSIDPFSSADFLRRMLHAVPSNKLFIFGGDSFYPFIVVGYAEQTRQWLYRVLRTEITEEFLTEQQAIRIAHRWMHENQLAVFPLPT
jgi:predicted TIM-barrel fold metal-dependent hydrolase